MGQFMVWHDQLKDEARDWLNGTTWTQHVRSTSPTSSGGTSTGGRLRRMLPSHDRTQSVRLVRRRRDEHRETARDRARDEGRVKR